MDLHLHTPRSSDYQEPGVSYLDILRQAEIRGLDIIAFTDHNTVAGYRAMTDEIDQLKYLEALGRIQPDEKRTLAEYRRLREKILVLPGFEFTATFGFHILGIFSPATPVRQLEHILLSLNIPPATLDEARRSSARRRTLTAYRMINTAGGSSSPPMRIDHGSRCAALISAGKQIAYTQDFFLHALEVTVWIGAGAKRRRASSGTKPEYPAPCVASGSDAHRLLADPRNQKTSASAIALPSAACQKSHSGVAAGLPEQ